MNLSIIGMGGVGGYFGGKLAQLLKDDKNMNINFISRGRHLEEIQKNGLILDADGAEMVCRPSLATDRIQDLPPQDLCLVCVKAYDLDNAMRLIKPRIKDSTMLLPILNGVDIYERIRAVISNGIVFPSCVYIGTHIEKPGKVVQKGGAGTIIFGKDPANDFTPEVVFDLFNKAGIKYKWTKDPYAEIWGKYVFIASFGLVSADSGKTLGEILRSAELSKSVGNIMAEIVEIAGRKRIDLPKNIIEDTFAKAKTFPAETKTSFQRDFEASGKPDERDLFGGAVIRMGKLSGAKTEATEAVYRSIMEKKP
jgi:2-dehydropantoate 2-reductase